MTFIVDTSVVLKWYAPEPDSEIAAAWLNEPLLAPDLILAELGNAMWKKARRDEIRPAQASAALPHLRTYVRLVRSDALAEPALSIAMELGHPIYDCFFLALAEEKDVVLVTSDQRLVRRCAATRHGKRIRTL